VQTIVHFLRELRNTGAVAPSSKHLVHAAVSQLRAHLARHPRSPVRILELGPGTGVFTREIVAAMRPEDSLDVVELSERFFNLVHAQYHGGNVRVVHADVLEFAGEGGYDFIFSSIPYEALPKEVSTAIWRKKQSLACQDAHIIYYKYVNPTPFRSDYEREIVRRHLVGRRIIWRNVPPARLFTLRMDRDNAAVAASLGLTA
jgi:phospholipid N-methyltransferase